MAKKTPSHGEEDKALTNIGARRDRMNKGFEKLYQLEIEKKELEEEYLNEVKDKIKTERKNITADCNVEAADWKIMYAAYKREQYAKSLQDEGDRDRILDNLKFAHQVLASGKMVDFISVMEKADKKKADEAKQADEAKAA